MATMVAVYFLAIVLAIALGGICDRLEKIANHLHNINLELASQRHGERKADEKSLQGVHLFSQGK